jgi:hypothetical protein
MAAARHADVEGVNIMKLQSGFEVGVRSSRLVSALFVVTVGLIGCSQLDDDGSSGVSGLPGVDGDRLAVKLGALDGGPRTIPYGGYVDFDGEPVNASGVKFNFALFPCANPGPDSCSHLWVARGTWNDAVAWSLGWPTGADEVVPLPIFSGRFTVELGGAGHNSLPNAVFHAGHETLYLAVRIEGRSLGNLQKVTPAARARFAHNGVPPGTVSYFAVATPPIGWLPCDGRAVSRTTYDELFAVIGTTYGTGDGATTFNLPDTMDRLHLGSPSVGTSDGAWTAETTTNGEHHHQVPLSLSAYAPALGSPYILIDDQLNAESVPGPTNHRVMITPGFNAVAITDTGSQTSSTRLGTTKTGDHAHTVDVRPPTLTLLPIIKY